METVYKAQKVLLELSSVVERNPQFDAGYTKEELSELSDELYEVYKEHLKNK